MTEPMGDIAHHDDIKSFVNFNAIAETCKPPNSVSVEYWKIYDNGDAYVAILPKKWTDTKVEEATQALRRVPDENIYPALHSDVNLTILQPTKVRDDSIFIKRPSLTRVEHADYGNFRDNFLAEAKVLEQISQKPHENIAEYYGCYQRDDRLTGIALRRYKRTLWEHFQQKSGDLDIEAFMERLESAVRHLHSMGLAHNDLTPCKIMLNTENMPVLIGFRRCQPFGAEGGTVELREEPHQDHDIDRLESIRTWLMDPTKDFSEVLQSDFVYQIPMH